MRRKQRGLFQAVFFSFIFAVILVGGRVEAQSFDSFEEPATTSAPSSFSSPASSSQGQLDFIQKPQGVQAPVGHPLKSRFLIDPAKLLGSGRSVGQSQESAGNQGGSFGPLEADGQGAVSSTFPGSDVPAVQGGLPRSARPALVLGQVPVAARQPQLGEGGKVRGRPKSFLDTTGIRQGQSSNSQIQSAPLIISGEFPPSPQLIAEKKKPSFEEGFDPIGLGALRRKRQRQRENLLEKAPKQDVVPPTPKDVSQDKEPAVDQEPSQSTQVSAPPKEDTPIATNEKQTPNEEKSESQETTVQPPQEEEVSTSTEEPTKPSVPADVQTAVSHDSPVDKLEKNLPEGMVGFIKVVQLPFQEGSLEDPSTQEGTGLTKIVGETLTKLPDRAEELTVDYPIYHIRYENGQQVDLPKLLVRDIRSLAKKIKKKGFKGIIIKATAFNKNQSSQSASRQIALSRRLLVRSYFLEMGFSSSDITLSLENPSSKTNQLTILLKK